MENKNSYFLLAIRIKLEFWTFSTLLTQLDDAVDHVLYAISVTIDEKENYRAFRKDNSLRIYIFRTNNRKRRGYPKYMCICAY